MLSGLLKKLVESIVLIVNQIEPPNRLITRSLAVQNLVFNHVRRAIRGAGAGLRPRRFRESGLNGEKKGEGDEASSRSHADRVPPNRISAKEEGRRKKDPATDRGNPEAVRSSNIGDHFRTPTSGPFMTPKDLLHRLLPGFKRSFLPTAMAAAMLGIGTIARPADAAAPPEGFTRTGNPGDWGEIVGIVPVGDGRFVAWEREGVVWMLGPDLAMSMEPMLDIHDEVGAWRDHGLLGLALDPNFLENGRLYLLYAVDRYFLLNADSPDYDPEADLYFQASIGRITRYAATMKSDFSTIDPKSRTILLGDDITNGLPILGHACCSMN